MKKMKKASKDNLPLGLVPPTKRQLNYNKADVAPNFLLESKCSKSWDNCLFASACVDECLKGDKGKVRLGKVKLS